MVGTAFSIVEVAFRNVENIIRANKLRHET